ncbi:hypothetical protein ADEAN_000197500 [Angomonas deanei]|uniref:Uncharacterized protein n=1 Tax=Angomonas deanei TaxID=59799 RepID=A0A7G2C412_9TRYP|nr:hypothetical protein ADEAN_000197500 [Angomonas deanei]
MSWPFHLLNSSNKRLHEEIGRRNTELVGRQKAIAENKDIVALMKKNLVDSNRQIKTLQSSLTVGANTLEALASETKQLTAETEGARRVSHSQENNIKRLKELEISLHNAFNNLSASLKEKTKLSREIELEAQQVVVSHLERQHFGEALEKEKQSLSTSVWAKLEGLHLTLAERRNKLELLQSEHDSVLRQLDRVRAQLQEALADQRNNIQEMGLVSKESAALDKAIEANTEKMSLLKDEQSRLEGVRQEEYELLNKLTENLKRQKHAVDTRQRKLNQKNSELTDIVERLRDELNQTEVLKSQKHADSQHYRAILVEYQNLYILAEEKQEILEVQKRRLQFLKDTLNTIEKEIASSCQVSPFALRELYGDLQRQLEYLEERIERATEKKVLAISAFHNEAKLDDNINKNIKSLKKQLVEIEKNEEWSRDTMTVLSSNLGDLEANTEERKKEVREAKASLEEMRQKSQYLLRTKVAELERILTQHMDDNNRLLRDNTALRSSLIRNVNALDQNRNAQSNNIEKERLIEIEIDSLTQELTNLREERNSIKAKLGGGEAMLQMLLDSAAAQLKTRQGVAGIEDLLRAQAQIEMDKINAEMQGALLELHLEQNDQREQVDSLQRLSRKRDLIRSRYEELMASLARKMKRPLEEAEDESGVVLTSSMESDGLRPEEFHARMLLQRSILRERLMERGNYLDLKIVSLERETNALRATLDAFKAEKSRTYHDVKNLKCALSGPAQPLFEKDPNENRTEPEPAVKQMLRNNLSHNSELFSSELSLQEEAIRALKDHTANAKENQRSLKTLLSALEKEVMNKKRRAQKLRDELHKERTKLLRVK